jgi:hypothetical protein
MILSFLKPEKLNTVTENNLTNKISKLVYFVYNRLPYNNHDAD